MDPRSVFQYFARGLPPRDIPYKDLHDDEIELVLRHYGPGSDYVGGLPSWQFAIRRLGERRNVGMCDLRVGWSDEILYAGHIGYRILLPYRGHGYAERASRLLLALAERVGMEEVLITCDPDNAPSRRTLEKLNGRFEGIVTVPEKTVAYELGDREKCLFYYESAAFALPPSA